MTCEADLDRGTGTAEFKMGGYSLSMIKSKECSKEAPVMGIYPKTNAWATSASLPSLLVTVSMKCLRILVLGRVVKQNI